MANQEHLDMLKQGVKTWNQWRKEHVDIRPDLRGANLAGANLAEANLLRASLTHANLTGAFLTHANLREAILTYANLREAYLIRANLTQADLKEAILTAASIGWTVFGNVNLSTVKGLDTIIHDGPSTIGIDTIYSSHGNIPEVFLRRVGVPETFLTNMRALVNSTRPLDFYSCFISYSNKDQSFAERLYADLQAKGVRCWFAPQDLKIGDKFRSRIDEAVRMYDKVLIVLSEHSIRSPWVEKEVEEAFEKERKRKKLVLFPVRLDDAVKRTKQAWAADIRRSRHIGDFCNWKQHDEYQKAFNRLLHDLKSEA